MILAQLSRTPVETVNFHVWQPCNMSCRFCFATFRDVRQTVLPEGHLSCGDAEQVVALLADAGFRKITFAGGEPLLCPWLTDLIGQARSLGLTTALVTNGSLLDSHTIERLRGILDWVTISIDSVRPRSLELLGRRTAGKAFGEHGYSALCRAVRASGLRLKINTVVTEVNWREDMSEFIIGARPERWKILQVLPVQGQNSQRVDPLVITSRQFEEFVTRHLRVELHGIKVLPEDNDAMTGSYAMVDPAGRFFDAVDPRGYTYSEPILQVGASKAISQIVISREKFLARGGLYEDDADTVGVR